MSTLIYPELPGWPYKIEETICFAGHRTQSIPHQYHADCKQQLRRMIEKSLSQGYKNFISGLARGVDLWAIEIVLEIPGAFPIGACPFSGHHGRWSHEEQNAFFKIREKINEVGDYYTIPMEALDPDEPQFNFDEPDVWIQVGTPEHAFFIREILNRRNRWMVRRSDMVLGVFTGQKSGTKNAIDFATSQGRKVCTYNFLTQAFERWDGIL